jgi:hypothetical protein
MALWPSNQARFLHRRTPAIAHRAVTTPPHTYDADATTPNRAIDPAFWDTAQAPQPEQGSEPTSRSRR